MSKALTQKEKKILSRMGERIRQIRKEKAITQAELVHNANLHGNMVGRIERGERMANVITLIRIAKALDVNVKDFFDPPE